MRQISDNRVNLCLTDIPYGIKSHNGTKGFGKRKNRRYVGNWDNNTPDKKYFEELFRISENQIIFGGNHVTQYLKPTNGWIVWDKVGNIKFNNPFSDCELAWTSFSKPMKKYEYLQQGFLSKEKERFHPTQKPVGLFEQILSDYSEEGDIIFDGYCGSGTTAVSCIKLNRKCICCEIDETYYKKSIERIEEEIKQPDLFYEKY